ncbi:MAG: hypothetical protein ACYDAQ_11840, partial [Mycobacteriales bacterium]
MTALLVACARCSTDAQALTVQRVGLVKLGVETQRIYVEDELRTRPQITLSSVAFTLPVARRRLGRAPPGAGCCVPR